MSVTVMKAPDGRLYEVDSQDVETLQRDQGYQVAPEAEVTQRQTEREQWQKYGGIGQQALGLAETAARNATLGLVSGLAGDEQEQRERAAVVEEDSPILNAAAGVAPAVAAGVATGGAGLGVAGSIAAEGALGGWAGVGAAADEAFKHDQELSAEAALGSYASGFLLGGAAAGAVAGAGRALGATRNRFIEASGKAARKAEQEAFAASGVVRPVKGLSEAVNDPVKAAALRKAGQEARPLAQKRLVDELGAMEGAERAVSQSTASRALDDAFPGAEVASVAEGRAAARSVIASARDEFIDAPAVRGRFERAMEALDRSNTPGEILSTARALRASIDDALDVADDPEIAKRLQGYAVRARELEGNAKLFGGAAKDTAARTAAQDALSDARIALQGQLEAGNYLGQIGTAAAKPIDEALDTYMERLGAVLQGSDDPAAKEGLAAIGRLRAARDVEFQAVAGANQADAMRQFAKDGAGETPSVLRDVLGEVGETAIEAVIPGAGLARKAWKYRKHIARLAGGARMSAGVAADRLLGTALSSVGRGSRALARAPVPLGLRALSMQDVDENPEKAYGKIKELVRTLSQEPERIADALAAQMGDMATEAPELLDWSNAKAARIVDFLKEKMPPAMEYSMLYPEGPPPSRTDIIQISLYWHGLTQPEDVVKAIGDGSAMPEEVEAFRAASPAWFTELQEALQERIVVANKRGIVVPAYRISQLESLLDLHGKLDPTFGGSVASVARMQDEAAAAEIQQPSYTPQPRAGERIAQESPAV